MGKEWEFNSHSHSLFLGNGNAFPPSRRNEEWECILFFGRNGNELKFPIGPMNQINF